MRKLMFVCAVALFLSVSVLISLVRADDPSTVYTGGDWSDPNSWSAGVPDANTVAIISQNCTVNAEYDCDALRIETSGTICLTLDGATQMHVRDKVVVGDDVFVLVWNYSVLSCPRIEASGGGLDLSNGAVYVNYLVGLNVSLNPNGGWYQKIVRYGP